MDNNIIISLKDIVVDFDGETILNGLSLDIHDKEFVTLLGPSGCGKTTTLRIIGGFQTPKSGSVFFDGKDIADLPPYKREVNTVFQKYALFSHLNVFENIAFGLRLKKLPDQEIKAAGPGRQEALDGPGHVRVDHVHQGGVALTHLDQHPCKCSENCRRQITAPIFQRKSPLSEGSRKLHNFTCIVYHGKTVLSSLKL